MDQQIITFNDKQYKLDKYGFLDPSKQWDENFAEGMARKLGIHEGLTKAHWKVIHYLRSKFLAENTIPVIVIACADNQFRLKELRALFPTGYHRGACMIAGINFDFMSDINIWLTYETPPKAKMEYEVDELGFLKDFDKWNERFASLVVSKWDLPAGLTKRHWKIIQYLRDYFDKTKNIPTVYETCKSNDIEFEEIGILFPKGYRRGACRAAGLPFFA
jgi:TusE/DsrC/DsvC family sulfur relay protein